jgi:hypothetical protein
MYALWAGGIVLAFILSYMKGRISGAKLERQKQAAAEAKAKAIADEIDDKTSAGDPAANRKELETWAKP